MEPVTQLVRDKQRSRNYVLPAVTLTMAAIIVFVLLCVSTVRAQGPQITATRKATGQSGFSAGSSGNPSTQAGLSGTASAQFDNPSTRSHGPVSLVRLDRSVIAADALTEKIKRLMEMLFLKRA